MSVTFWMAKACFLEGHRTYVFIVSCRTEFLKQLHVTVLDFVRAPVQAQCPTRCVGIEVWVAKL